MVFKEHLFFIEMFAQFVSGCKDLWHGVTIVEYLNRHTEEDPIVTIPYVLKHYQCALRDEYNYSIFWNSMREKIKRRGPEAAEKLYQDLLRENPGFLDDTGVVVTLSRGAPILFWKHFNPSGKRVNPVYIQDLYKALTPPQKKTYAAAALQLSGYLLQYLAVKYRTKSLCMIAVTKDGPALKHVPKKIKTNKIVKAAISQSASAMEYATPVQRIKFIELAVMGSGKIYGDYRPGGFSKKDWTRPWAMEVWAALSDTRKEDLKKRWKQQKRDDENRWHWGTR
jgi:hypothetical protein